MSSPSPFRGLRSGALLALAFYFFWKPFIVVVGVAALYLLAHRFIRWAYGQPRARRFLAACVLLWCAPRPVDGWLYDFCQLDHA